MPIAKVAVVTGLVAFTLSALSLPWGGQLWFIAFPFLVVGLASSGMTLRHGEGVGIRVVTIAVNLVALLTLLITAPITSAI